MEIGKAIRKYRTEAGLTMASVAAALGYSSSSTIVNWESGTRHPPVTVIPMLAKVLGCTITDLFAGE